ncbi:MAG: GNAT family N-acetyltransferase [Leptolyngbya sp. SIO3F4]|nr:GNAT family N-acetyltransferase [Leptolyngbya sp. SIO3F4]
MATATTDGRSFFGQIDRTDWQRHLASHHLFICNFQQFLAPFKLPRLIDRFLGILRFRCFKQAGPTSRIEGLNISFQPPDIFHITIAFSNIKENFSEKYLLKLTDILAWSVSSEPLLNTQRLGIHLLLPSDETAIIDFIKAPEVWQMRGEYYAPLVNIHSVYSRHTNQQRWYSYYFVLRSQHNSTPIGFIRFYQISRPSVVTPVISQTPYEPVMLSYGLAKQYWGQGLMSEAVSACLPWFITDQNVQEIVAFVEINNQGSCRILQKLGLQEYGLLESPKISSDLKKTYRFMIYKSV